MDLGSLRVLPKAELHLHLDGCLLPATAVALAADAGMALTEAEARRRLVAPARCRNQAELLAYFDLAIALMQSAPALARVASELVDSLVADGVRYAEVRWAPRLHLARGLSVRDVIGAVADGIAEGRLRQGKHAPAVALIVTAMRSDPPGANVELAHVAAGVGPPVVGFDLAGAEAEWPAPPHAAAFRAAAAGGLRLTAHAGEVPGAGRIAEVLDFGVERIAHGTAVADDDALVARLIDDGITLDMCPTSNVQAGIVTELAAHPLARLHRRGASVTLSTDDRVVSDVTLTDEMARTATALELSADELAAIALNGFDRAFAPVEAMSPLRAEARRAWAAWAASDRALTG